MKSGALCACLVLPGLAFAQATHKPVFEVASVKPSDPNSTNQMFIGMDADAGMVRYTNITLRNCIRAAYRVREFQIQGPEWINTVRFQIAAKLPAGASLDQIPDMMQALLEERFKLVLRRDSKEQSVYALVVGKGGPRLKEVDRKAEIRSETALGADGRPRPAMLIQFLPSGVVLKAPAASLANLVDLMSRYSHLPVVDMTGLEGQYQFELAFAPEVNRSVPPNLLHNGAPDGAPASSDPAPSLFDAVQQYGLKLEARKAPVKMLTITHVEKTPTEN